MGPEKFFVPYDGRISNHEATPLPFSIRTRAYIPGLLHDLPTHCLRQRAFRRSNDAICIWGRPRSQLSRLPPRNARSFDAGQGVPSHECHRDSSGSRSRRLATSIRPYWIGKHGNNRAKAMFRTECPAFLIAESQRCLSTSGLDFPQLRVRASLAARHVKRLL